MTHFVRARRPQVRFVQDPTMHVSVATMIPDGMHGDEPTYATATVIPSGMHSDFRTVRGNSSIERALIAKGIAPERARALVSRAAARIRRRRRTGLGDGEDASVLLASVQSRGGDFQRAHASLIAQIPSAQSDADRLRIRNAIEALYADWTAYAVGAKGGAAPYEWNRTDPVDAILIAVRDDLRDTVDLMDANKAQQAIAKQIAQLPTFGMPGKGGPLLGIDVPWYVWAAGAATGVAILSKAIRLW